MSALALARAQWRRLPLAWRRTWGNRLLGLAEPLLAQRLPHAQPSLQHTPSAAAELFGLFGAALGHATAADLLRLELLAAGISVSRQDLTGQAGAERGADRPAIADPPLGREAAAIVVANPDTMIVSMATGESRRLQDRRVIGYWVWELERAPARWARAAHALHEIWTPSAYSAAALRAVLDRPIRVVPHPAALSPPPRPTPEARAAARARFGAGPDTFVAASSFTATSSLARKNPVGAIAAFEAAFGGREDALLILRCLGGTRYPEAAAALRETVRASPARVLLLDPPGGLEELHALYAACDVYLSLHRAEGFGLNLAEAMLCERAVVATAYSAPAEFLDESCAALIPYRLTEVCDPQGIYRLRGAQWAEPEHDAAVSALRRLASDPEHGRALGLAAVRKAQEALSGGAAAAALRAPSG